MKKCKYYIELFTLQVREYMHHLSGYASIGTMVQRQLYGVWAFSCMIWCVEIFPLKRMNKYGKKTVQIFLDKPKNEVWVLTLIKNIWNNQYSPFPAMPISHFEPECQLIAGTWFKAAWREVLRHVFLWRKYSTTDGWPLPQLLVGHWVPMGPLMREYPQGVHPLRDLLYMPGPRYLETLVTWPP